MKWLQVKRLALRAVAPRSRRRAEAALWRAAQAGAARTGFVYREPAVTRISRSARAEWSQRPLALLGDPLAAG